MKEFIKSKGFKIAAIIISSFIIALVIFGSGVAVGLHKARFSYRFGENYERNFMGPRERMLHPGSMENMMRGFEGRDFRNAHGLAGTIISISDNTLVVKDQDGKENTVAVSDKTIIKDRRSDLEISDLEVNDRLVVMGTPGDNGVINADLIRVFDNGINTNNQ
jgi:hypothetical protein